MRILAKNKQKMKYALLIGEAPVYELDEDGNRIVDYVKEDETEVYRETGDTELTYSTPKDFKANISMSGSSAEAREYGLSTADYQAVIVFERGAFPITEGSLIWFRNGVRYRNNGEMVEVETKDGKNIKTKNPEPISADFEVLKISDSLNITKAILKAVNK